VLTNTIIIYGELRKRFVSNKMYVVIKREFYIKSDSKEIVDTLDPTLDTVDTLIFAKE